MTLCVTLFALALSLPLPSSEADIGALGLFARRKLTFVSPTLQARDDNQDKSEEGYRHAANRLPCTVTDVEERIHRRDSFALGGVLLWAVLMILAMVRWLVVDRLDRLSIALMITAYFAFFGGVTVRFWLLP